LIKYQCESCKATYPEFDGQGYQVFHTCPEGTKNPRNENIVVMTGYHIVKNKDGFNEEKQNKRIKSKGKGRKQIGVQTL
tara:strand:- start:471 stop:707 length:237 start_codon:yes stop_codon:yes gene_type:complete